MSRKRFTLLLNFAVWTAAFAVAFTQWPLYSENQNTKFLQGLARAGIGTLNEDWLANTVDPLPVFSALVQFTAGYLHPGFFYLFQAVLLGIYLFSLAGIADIVFGLNRTRAGTSLFLVIVIGIHSSLIFPFSLSVLGTSLGWLLQAGVANQYLFNPVFQPATFGVLLVLSIYLFLRGKPFAAAATAALAGVFHTTYLPSAGILTLGYVFLTWWEDRNLTKAGAVGFLAFAIVFPVLLYNGEVLGPTTPDAWERAQAILVNDRIPHHTLPEIWLDRTVYVKMGIVLLAMIVVRRSRLFPIMLFVSLVALAFSVPLLFVHSDLLSFMTPWRTSAFLVPLSSTMLVAWAITKVFNRQVGLVNRYQMPIMIVAAAILLLTVSAGARAMQDSFTERRDDLRNGIYGFARMTEQPGTTYLTPTYMADFRLATGRPVVVTWKSHPYKDVEVIEWKERIDTVNGFYNKPSCGGVGDLAEKYGVTHVLFEGQSPLDDCTNVEMGYQDESFTVLVVKGAR